MNNKEIFVKTIGRLVDLGFEKTCDDHYNKFSVCEVSSFFISIPPSSDFALTSSILYSCMNFVLNTDTVSLGVYTYILKFCTSHPIGM